MLKKIWDDHLKGLVTELMDVVGKLIDGAMKIFNEFIAPIMKWLLDKLAPAFQTAFGIIMSGIGVALGTIADVAKGIIKALDGIIDIVVGVFTGDWERAWEGVKNIFKGIVDTLVTIFKAPINGIISAINGAIKGLNKIKIPNWVPKKLGGGKGINIPEIPMLADGGLVEQPTLAMAGEGKDSEAVVPLNESVMSQLGQMISEHMGSGQATESGGGDETFNINLNLDGSILEEWIVSRQQHMSIRTNGR